MTNYNSTNVQLGVLQKHTTLVYLSLTVANMTLPTAGTINTIARYL